jgi:hypothetical protein
MIWSYAPLAADLTPEREHINHYPGKVLSETLSGHASRRERPAGSASDGARGGPSS